MSNESSKKTKFSEYFFNLYNIQKTLRFELKPVGETASFLEDFKSHHLINVVNEDEQRALDYLAVKKIIDDYHRAFIDNSLASIATYITVDDLHSAYNLYCETTNSSPEDKPTKLKELADCQTGLRKKLIKCFGDTKKLFSKDLIKTDLPLWLEGMGRNEDLEVVDKFKDFTTYFKGFHENRKNMYSDEEQSTAIAYRVINENLMKFFDNIITFNEIKEKFPDLNFAPVLSSLGVAESPEDVFSIGCFFKVVSQLGIDKYNFLLGGKSLEDGTKLQGVNETINLFKQKLPKEQARQVGRMTFLFKQILSDLENEYSFIPQQFETDKELLNALKMLHEQSQPQINALRNLLISLKEIDNSKVFIKTSDLSSLSQAVWGSYRVFNDIFEHHTQNFSESKKKAFEGTSAFSLYDLGEMCQAYNKSVDGDNKISFDSLINYFSSEKVLNKIFDDSVADAYKTLQHLFELDKLSTKRRPPVKSESKGEDGFEQIKVIKDYLDSLLNALHLSKPLRLVKGRKPILGLDKDMAFYNEFDVVYADLESLIIPLYNKARNYLSRKPFSKDKVKINFSNNTLLAGWDANKETDNASIIFRKNDLYYLGVMKKGNTNLFDFYGSEGKSENSKNRKKETALKALATEEDECYEKVRYKLLPLADRNLPRVIFAKSNIDYYSPSEKILSIRNTSSHTKGGAPQKGFKKADFSKEDCHAMIDFYKACIAKHPEWRDYGFKFSPTSTFEDITGFYAEVESQGYAISFDRIKASYINEQIAQGNLFLFQIYNKDFSPFHKGKPNLHTMYWKAVFEEENLRDVVVKLNGEAEIFFRRHSIDKKDIVTHRAGGELENKNPLNEKKHSTFTYDLIKDRRYTKDKFFFHVPVSLNFKAKGTPRFNNFTNLFLKNNSDVHVIGLDRGERHLLYFTVINQRGEIIEQDSLNALVSDTRMINDYQQKLDQKEKERDAARKSWTTVENIKELKEGYLSHVVHKLAQLIIKYNAIVCLEDLNFGFKRGRFKVEKQVYQKFEKALIDKLNYLVFKESKFGQAGHYLKAYQLTDRFESFSKLGKQTGILFYVPAEYTSKIDPMTGYTDRLNIKYQSLEKSQALLSDFDSIRYNSSEGYFEFIVDYKKLLPKANSLGPCTRWVICTAGDTRYQNIRNDNGQWETKTVNVTEETLALLQENFTLSEQELLANGHELKDVILQQKDAGFYRKLLALIKISMTLRHSRINSDDDFILSPVKNSMGGFFDSRNADDSLPKDADANGAYHIALKGLWCLREINRSDKPKLAIKSNEWFEFIQQKPYVHN